MPRKNDAAHLASSLFVSTAIAFSICVAWLFNERILGTRRDNSTLDWANSVGGSLGDILAVDPIIAALVVPLATFPALVVGYILILRRGHR